MWKRWRWNRKCAIDCLISTCLINWTEGAGGISFKGKWKLWSLCGRQCWDTFIPSSGDLSAWGSNYRWSRNIAKECFGSITCLKEIIACKYNRFGVWKQNSWNIRHSIGDLLILAFSCIGVDASIAISTFKFDFQIRSLSNLDWLGQTFHNSVFFYGDIFANLWACSINHIWHFGEISNTLNIKLNEWSSYRPTVWSNTYQFRSKGESFWQWSLNFGSTNVKVHHVICYIWIFNISNLKKCLSWDNSQCFLFNSIHIERSAIIIIACKIDTADFDLPRVGLNIKFSCNIGQRRNLIGEVVSAGWVSACSFLRGFLENNHRSILAFMLFFSWCKVLNSTCDLCFFNCLEVAMGASKSSVVANLYRIVGNCLSKVRSMNR